MSLTDFSEEELAVSLMQEHFQMHRKGITEALKRGHDPLSVDDVEECLIEGTAQYWPHKQSCVVTSIQDRGECRVLTIWLAAGKLDECLEIEDLLQCYAREMDCDRIEIAGRTGWQRVLQGRGYKQARVVLIKELSDG